MVPAGTRLTPGRLAAAAASGVAELSCARLPRVAVLATGSELVDPGGELRPGQIYETNGLMLSAALAATGAEVVSEPPVADDEEALREALERGLAADVLVTSGGVSVGEHDLVRAVERELGVEEIFWRVSIKPGKPVSFGVRGDTLVFGLPGNPVSALVGCELFVKPALRALQGIPDPLPRFEPGRLASALRRNEERDEFVRARSRSDGDSLVLEPVTGQESHMIVRSVWRGRARARSTWKRSSSRPARRCAGSASLLVDRAACLRRRGAPARREDERADELAQRTAAGALLRVGVRRVAVRRERGELPSRREPGEADQEQGQRRVADGEEIEDVPRRIPAQPVVGGERPDEVGRPDQAGAEDTRAHSRPAASAPAAARARRAARAGRR